MGLHKISQMYDFSLQFNSILKLLFYFRNFFFFIYSRQAVVEHNQIPSNVRVCQTQGLSLHVQYRYECTETANRMERNPRETVDF